MNLLAIAGVYGMLLPTIGLCLVLLLLYGVIRVAVARGMRDHQIWMEKNRPGVGPALRSRPTVGQYLGLTEAPRPTTTDVPDASGKRV